jgi:hypothetical protein
LHFNFLLNENNKLVYKRPDYVTNKNYDAFFCEI